MQGMILHNDLFELIKNGIKTIEFRLNDEKGRLIKIHDKVNMYNSFEKLYNYFGKKSLRYNEDDIANFKDIKVYYSKENRDRYGLVGMEMIII